MNWWLAGLLGAIIWGIHYPLIDKALEKMSMITVMLLTCVPILVAVPFYKDIIIQDYHTFLGLNLTNKLLISSILFTSISATFLIYFAIGSKNATLASLIEITYPVFVVLFAFIILKENHLNFSIIFGGILVFIGVGIIILGNR